MHIITHLDLGGAEGVAMHLIEGLVGPVEAAIFAVIEDKALSPIGRDMARQAQALGVPVFFGTRRGFKSGGVVLAAWRLARAVKRFHPDVLHVHTEIPELTLALACIFSPHVARMPLLRTVHNSVLWIDWNRIGAFVTRRLAHGTAVAVSQAAADADMATEAKISRPRAAVVYNAVRQPPPIASRKVGDGPLKVLFAGRLVHQKGADLLPAILERAQTLACRQDVEVIVAGHGACRDELAGAFDRWAGPWRVRMTGAIAQLSQHLGDYDVVLLPSRFEGFGLLHLEVMMAGVPLVTCRAPGIAEVLPANHPLATEPGDVEALARTLADALDDIEDNRARALTSVHELTDRFAPTRMMAIYLEHYRMLANMKAAA